MKLFPIYLYLMFCLFLTSCDGCKDNVGYKSKKHATIPKYTTSDSGAVSYAVGGVGTGDQINSVTYTLKGGIDTTITNPSISHLFWESPVDLGQGVSFSADAIPGSSSYNGLTATMFVYDHKGQQAYTTTVNFK